jgi:hypothetical protein
MSSPICPSHFWILQRHDRWRKTRAFPDGEIVRAQWKMACLSDRRTK